MCAPKTVFFLVMPIPESRMLRPPAPAAIAEAQPVDISRVLGATDETRGWCKPNTLCAPFFLALSYIIFLKGSMTIICCALPLVYSLTMT